MKLLTLLTDAETPHRAGNRCTIFTSSDGAKDLTIMQTYRLEGVRVDTSRTPSLYLGFQSAYAMRSVRAHVRRRRKISL